VARIAQLAALNSPVSTLKEGGMKARVAIAMMAIAGLSVSPVFAQDHNHAEHADRMMEQAAVAPNNLKLPAGEDGAKQRLSSSPRHSEWVKINVNGTPVNTFVVYPERKDKAPVVLVIQEIFGLTDWIRGVADQLAAEGFIGIAPDLLSGHGPNGGGTEAYPSRDDVTKAVMALPSDEIMARLNAARDHGIKLPAANGASATVGFCFGGSQSFAYAVAQPGLNAAVVYYGTAPNQPGAAQGSFTPAASLAQIKAPVLGLYGGADDRVNATIVATRVKMKEFGKTYEPHTFDNAGHGFLRAQTGQNGANMQATERAWPMTIVFLKKHTGGGSSKSQ
jgi:carboxymethylenebutenolidase